MRVLFVGNPSARPGDGGSATVQNSLHKALIEYPKTDHQFFYVQPVPGANNVQSMVAGERIDFVWFLSPYYEPIDAPFAITVWDLAHRRLPYFPEVSTTGWTWDMREQFYSYVLPKAAMVIAANSMGAAEVRDFYRIPSELVKIIPPPIDVDPDGPQEPCPIDDKFLLYPAQFWPHKNHITLIDMLALLHMSNKRYKMVFCGADKGNMEYVKSYAHKRDLHEYVLFPGFVSDAQLRWLYKHAFAMVFASMMGPDNLPPYEAAAYGCPVICADYPGLEDFHLTACAMAPEIMAQSVVRLEYEVFRSFEINWNKSIAAYRTGPEYIRCAVELLDNFSNIRRLWGPWGTYKHL